MNEILIDWKPYQILKPHDKKVQIIKTYLSYSNAVHDINHDLYYDIDEKNFCVKEIKFMGKTIYLVSGINKGYSEQRITLIEEIEPMLFRYLEDGTKNTMILYVDPIKDFYLNPRTIVSKDLKTYDKEWMETEEDKRLYSWFYKVYIDLREFVIDCYTENPKYTIYNDWTIELCDLLVQSVFVWYYSNDLDEDTSGLTGIIKSAVAYDPSNIIMIILLSIRIYSGYNVTKQDGIGLPKLSDSYKKSMYNIILLSKVFTTEEFKDADVLTRSMMIKEKEFEINHD
jgi:hypothetical protein